MSKDVAVAVNPRTGRIDVVVAGGGPVYDDTRTHKVLSRLSATRAAWWADTNGDYGSQLRSVKNIRRATPSELEAFAREALAPLVTTREILPPRGQRDLRVEVTVDRALGRAWIAIGWSTPGGTEESTRYPLAS